MKVAKRGKEDNPSPGSKEKWSEDKIQPRERNAKKSVLQSKSSFSCSSSHKFQVHELRWEKNYISGFTNL